MKKWRIQLKSRKILHFIFIAINIFSFFMIVASNGASYVGIWIITWLNSGIYEICLLVFECQIRIKKLIQKIKEKIKERQNHDIP